MPKTSIEWTDASWNPIVPVNGGWGCTKVSEGCRHCYAETLNRRFGNKREFKGAWRFKWRETKDSPLRRGRPTRYFVCDMTDVCHPDVPADLQYKLRDVVEACPQHTFQFLTKRAERWPTWWTELPNVWVGTSAEDQRVANERIPRLLKIQAAVRFLSVEPLLALVVIPEIDRLDWVIVGGESGSKARMCDVPWIQSIIRQCRETGTPCFVKQLGSHAGVSGKGGDMNEWPEDLRVRQMPRGIDNA